MQTLLLDSHSLLFRAFHALPPMSTTQGEPTNALYGFCVLLLKLLREERPCEVAIARDLPGKTLRHERYAAYKAGRPQTSPLLVRQLELFEELVEALGFPLVALAGYEADDVLATLATRQAARGRDALVVSGDRDLLQLVDERCRVLFVGQRGKPPLRYDQAAVQARFGIPAERLPGYVALVGDSADNIPKVKGIGAAKASALMQQSATLAALLDDLAVIDEPRLRTLLAAHEAQLRQSEQLVRLHRDLPLPNVEPRALDAEACARTAVLLEKWECRSLLPRLNALIGTAPA
jgi:DNA polymerase-1